MIRTREPRIGRADPGRRWCGGGLWGVAALGLAILPWGRSGLGDDSGTPRGSHSYSTSEAPRDYRGPRPVVLALNDSRTVSRERVRDRELSPARALEPESSPPPVSPSPPKEESPRVASAVGHNPPSRLPDALSRSPVPSPTTGAAQDDPIAMAKQTIAACQARFARIQDYTCMFHKRERIDGRLTAPHVMIMKARTQPNSIYFKFVKPNRGREAIFVAGRSGGRVVAHDVGLGKLVAGTMLLDPRGTLAMEDNRHPVTEAGIGALIDTVAQRWATELTPEESRVVLHPQVRVGNQPCTMIESIHPRKRPDFLFHMVKLYIDNEHGLPIRFEAYDWPKHLGAAPELIEEYTYVNLRVNVGLRDHDFDPRNPQYSFGRF